MALIKQPKTAGFRLKSRYDIVIDWLSRLCIDSLEINRLLSSSESMQSKST